MERVRLGKMDLMGLITLSFNIVQPLSGAMANANSKSFVFMTFSNHYGLAFFKK
jgi:hypothetical protein